MRRIGLDPMAGTYPILGDPSLAPRTSTGGGGLISDLSSAAQQLGVGQAIDLLKGVVMPSIMGAIQSAAPAAGRSARRQLPPRQLPALAKTCNQTAPQGGSFDP